MNRIKISSQNWAATTSNSTLVAAIITLLSSRLSSGDPGGIGRKQSASLGKAKITTTRKRKMRAKLRGHILYGPNGGRRS
jgi:hypothetical protein